MYVYEYVATTAATPAAIWPLYADAAAWPRWDEGLSAVTIDGAFEPGTTGTVTPDGMDPVPFTLTDVVHETSFSDVSPIPGGTIAFEHVLEPVAAGTRVRHRVVVTGPAADEMGPMITSDTPDAVTALCALAESRAQAEPSRV